MQASSHANTTTTEVRTAVATFASTPLTPSFARIAVAAANRAESRDHVSQVIVLKISPCAILSPQVHLRRLPGVRFCFGTPKSFTAMPLNGATNGFQPQKFC